MRRPVCYDVTRILTRILNATPNGIDRVDHTLATHFLSGAPGTTFGATATGFGARVMSGAAARDAVAGIARHWGETRQGDHDEPAYRYVVARLRETRRSDDSEARPKPRRARPSLDARAIAGWTRRHGVPLFDAPRSTLPTGSIYLNASQFPLWVPASFAWLEARPDVRAAFFIHDLLPIAHPEYFPKPEFERHKRRLQTFARFATAGIVTTRTVAADLDAHLATLGRTNVPLFVAPTPIAPIFATPRVIDEALSGHPYFVLCSTIEPRKNHLMILAVWRALGQRLGRETPKLVLVGTRGWHFAPILDMIARTPSLRETVIEVNGLSTPSLKRLIDNARAVLMPTFGEGYGLPVHEALTAGAPVFASDIPVFRDIESEGLTLLSPLAGDDWLEAVARASTRSRSSIEPRAPTSSWSDYFGPLETFLDGL